MSFEVHCPGCQKSYTAEARMVGKKIRCRQCERVFIVESAEAASSSSSTLGRVSPGLARNIAGSGTTATAGPAVMNRPRATPPATPAARPAPATGVSAVASGDRFQPRASTPQPFAGSEALEAWVPLGLCLVAAVWVPTESIAENRSGAPWASVLQIGTFAALYFLLVAPITFFVLKRTLYKRLQLLPPQPRWRIIATFILPATLAFVFSMMSGITGFVIGALVGLVLVAIVFWLLFRLDAQETANVYAIVGGAFFGAAALSAVAMFGLAALINHSANASLPPSELKENPLGPQFVWTPPPAPEKSPVRHKPLAAPPTDAIASPSPSEPTPAAPQPQQPSVATTTSQGTSAPPVTPSPGAPAMGTSTSSATADSTLPGEDPDMDPALRSGLFGNGGAALDDPFVKAIQAAKLPWVKWAYVPADQGIFEQGLSPLSPSPFLAMFRMAGVGGRNVECCRLAPLYRGMGAVSLTDDGTDAAAVTGHYAVADDGTALLRLTNTTPVKVEILPFRGAGGAVTLTVPPELTKPGTDPGLITPDLLGAVPGRRFLVRWTSADQIFVQLYDFQSTGQPKLTLKLGQNDWPGVYAISPDGSNFAVPEREADRTFIAVRSLTNAGAAPMLFPASDTGEKGRMDPTGISFSPDGSRLAALMEHGNQGAVRSWLIAGELRQAEGTCTVPTADEMLGQVKGRPFDWMAGNKWLIHGRTLLDAGTGAAFGTLTDQLVIAQQMADDHTAYLTYLGTDGHPHIAVVKFNPGAMTPK